jgi:Holliday junction DNA helicase RuvA
VIAQLRGTVVEKGIDYVILDVGGLGFRVTVSLNTLATLPATGATAQLHTHLVVRVNAEEVLLLVGFATAEERAAFDLLTSVQGIGPKLAMAVLSTLDADELGRAVRAGDHARLVRIPGIGKKTAERLVLELRDKFVAGPGAHAAGVATGKRGAGTPAVVSALTNLGYKPAEAERAADKAAAAHPGAGVADLVKAALRILAE